jgi:hypothetical protein
MRRHASFLIASVLIFFPGCERTRLALLPGGAGGASALGGVTGTGGVAATGGGAVAVGGSRARAGGVLGSGGVQAAGGVIGTGGSISASGGSVSTTDLDACLTDADCTPCLWAPAPTDPSQCPGYFNCCGGFSATKKRCESNRAAWNASCPGQSPQDRACPCILLCEGDMAISCAAGRCIFTCPSTVDASPDAAFHDASVPDADLPDAANADCTPLPVEWAKEPSPDACRPISNTACIPEIDVGATVARENACLVSWGVPPSKCAGWPRLSDGQEFVVLTVDDCSYNVTIESLEACADSIQIEYRVQGTCTSCEGQRSNFRVLVLPRDSRPVVAVSQGIVMPPCPPPPPPPP